MDIQIYSNDIRIEAENEQSNVTLRNVDLALFMGQFNVKEVLEAIMANDGYSEIVDFVAEVEKEKSDEPN